MCVCVCVNTKGDLVNWDQRELGEGGREGLNVVVDE